MSIEVEIRGIITKEEFDKAKVFLDQKSSSKVEDNRETYFFIVPNLNLKVANAKSNGTAKIALKTGSESQIANEELEISIKPEDTETAIKIFNHLGFDKYKRSDQIRTNYIYKELEIALKWSQDWSYHFEMEFVTDDNSKVEELKKQLHVIASEIGLTPMTESQLEDYITNLRKKQGLI